MAVAAYDAEFKALLCRGDSTIPRIKTVKDLEAAKFIKAFAEHLKRQGRFELPKWNDMVKTGVSRELAPYDPDWLYTRAASIVRKIYIRPGSGVGAFSKVYGAQFRRGTQKNDWRTASRKIIRYCCIQLADMELIEEDENGGRRITKNGQRELDTVANQVGAEEEGEAEDDDA